MKGAYALEGNQGAKRARDVHEVPGAPEMLPKRLILHLLQAPKDDGPSVVWQPDTGTCKCNCRCLSLRASPAPPLQKPRHVEVERAPT